MKKIFIQSLIALTMLSILTGVIYPISVTILAKMIWKEKSEGSQIVLNNQVIGSEHLAQQFLDKASFWPRPSAVDYKTVPGGASNLGPTSQKLKDIVNERLKIYEGETHVPYELLMASGSGLDPHISPTAARFQVKRIAQQRSIPEDRIQDLIVKHTEGSTLGIFGKDRVNVLKLNLALRELRN